MMIPVSSTNRCFSLQSLLLFCPQHEICFWSGPDLSPFSMAAEAPTEPVPEGEANEVYDTYKI